MVKERESNVTSKRLSITCAQERNPTLFEIKHQQGMIIEVWVSECNNVTIDNEMIDTLWLNCKPKYIRCNFIKNFSFVIIYILCKARDVYYFWFYCVLK